MCGLFHKLTLTKLNLVSIFLVYVESKKQRKGYYKEHEQKNTFRN
jgi:hypothetical protein